MYFPERDWETLASGAVEVHAVPMRTPDRLERIAGFFAVVRPRPAPAGAVAWERGVPLEAGRGRGEAACAPGRRGGRRRCRWRRRLPGGGAGGPHRAARYTGSRRVVSPPPSRRARAGAGVTLWPKFVVTTPTTRDRLRADGLLQSEALPGAGQTLADAQGSVAADAALGGGRRRPLLVDLRAAGRPMERAARDTTPARSSRPW